MVLGFSGSCTCTTRPRSESYHYDQPSALFALTSPSPAAKRIATRAWKLECQCWCRYKSAGVEPTSSFSRFTRSRDHDAHRPEASTGLGTGSRLKPENFKLPHAISTPHTSNMRDIMSVQYSILGHLFLQHTQTISTSRQPSSVSIVL